MNRHRAIAILLVLAMLLSLTGCGESNIYRTLDSIGSRQYAIIFRLEDKLEAPITAAVQVLAAIGRLSEITRSYIATDAITLRGDPNAMDNLEETTESRTLIVGVEKDCAPFAWSQGGGYIGISAEIASSIAEMLGWELRIQPILPDDVEAQLASGNIDCAIGFDPSCVHADKYTVGPVYMESEIYLASSSGSLVDSMRDLKGQTIAATRDPVTVQALKDTRDVVRYAQTVVCYDTPAECITALRDGECVAVAMDKLILNAYINFF